MIDLIPSAQSCISILVLSVKETFLSPNSKCLYLHFNVISHFKRDFFVSGHFQAKWTLLNKKWAILMPKIPNLATYASQI